MLRFHFSNSHVFFKMKTFHNTRKIHSFTKSSTALLIDSLRVNKFLHLNSKKQSKLLVSIQAWLLLQRNRKKSRGSVRFWNSGLKKTKDAGIISKTHPQNTFYSLFCLICDKSIPVEHQKKADLDRHCTSINT